MKTRFIQKIGKRKTMFKYWGSCKGSSMHRTADALIGEGTEIDFSETDENHLPNIPAVCFNCGKHAEPDERVMFSKSISPKYNTPSGTAEPGDLYYSDHLPEDFYWSNHKGPHLFCVLPCGTHWNIDSRANNCKLPNNKTHRCWVRTGNPEDGTIHICKDGDTCEAGAGSIQTPGYHGFLHYGNLNKC